jgi:acyl carrier protein
VLSMSSSALKDLEMEQAAIYGELTTIMRGVLMQDDLVLSPGLTARQVEGWDSFKMIEIIVAVEAHFGIKVPSHQVDRLDSVGDLAALIMERRENVQP